MATKTEENWMENFKALKAHVEQTGHFPPKRTALKNFCKYQRKRLKAGRMPEEQKRLFLELAAQRSDDHTGGRKRKE